MLITLLENSHAKSWNLFMRFLLEPWILAALARSGCIYNGSGSFIIVNGSCKQSPDPDFDLIRLSVHVSGTKF